MFTLIRQALRNYVPLETRIKFANWFRCVFRSLKGFLRNLFSPAKLIRRVSRSHVFLGRRNNFVKRVSFILKPLLRFSKKIKNVLTRIKRWAQFEIKFFRAILKKYLLKRLIFRNLFFTLLEGMFARRYLRFWAAPQFKVEPEPKKVLLVIGTMGGGGAERQLCYLAKSLKKKGWEPVVAVNNLQGRENRRLLPLLKRELIRVVEIESLSLKKMNQEREKKLKPIFRSSLKLAQIIESERPQVIHSWMDYANCQVLLLSRAALDCKVILSLRSISPENFAIWSPVFRPIYKAYAVPRIKLVANSAAGSNSYEKWLKKFEIPVIPNMPNSHIAKRLKSAPQGHNRSNLTIIGCMRLSEEKNPDVWINLAIEICKQRQGVEFHLFGTGPLLNSLTKTVEEQNMQYKVVIHGFKEDPWSKRLWDIHLSTSRAEGMPNSVIEASTYGIPTVGFSIGGIPEILGNDAPFLAPPSNLELLKENLIRAIDAKSMRISEGKRARGKIKSEFSSARIVAQYIALYTS